MSGRALESCRRALSMEGETANLSPPGPLPKRIHRFMNCSCFSAFFLGRGREKEEKKTQHSFFVGIHQYLHTHDLF